MAHQRLLSLSDWDLSKTLWDFTYLYWNLTGGEGERDFCNPEVHAGIAVLGVALAVGLLSSVIPYGFEMVALRRMRPGLFGILMSLEPAAAALFALVVLGEGLSLIECVAMGCVIVASVGATRSAGASGPLTRD